MTVETGPLPGLEAGVEAGLVGVREQYARHRIELTPDGTGGVFVVIHDVPLGGPYCEERTWLGFQLSAAYPHCDVYPHYVERVTRRDNAAHGDGVAATEWQERAALQLSRRSNRWNPAFDNAALKASKVMSWFLTR